MAFISSGPGALEFFRRLIKDETSSEDVGFDGSSSGCDAKLGGLSRKSWTSWETLSKKFWLKLGFCGIEWIA